MGFAYQSPLRIRRIAASIIALGLFLQILYGIIHPTMASAATNFAISPDNLQGWQVSSSDVNGAATHFINTQGSIGAGSVQFALPDINQTQSLDLVRYGTTKLSNISILAYDTYVSTPFSVAPSFRLAIDSDVTDASINPEGYLVYSPYQNGQVSDNVWQHHNAREGMWWFSDAGLLDSVCSKEAPCSLDTIITLYPDMGIVSGGGVGFLVTNTTEPSISNIDGLTINDDTYNFEAISPPQLVSPVYGGVSEPTLTTVWQVTPTASQYIYESYNDEAMTQLRVSEALTDTKKTETDIADGSTIWWRVRAVSAQGDAGGWSELRKVTIVKDQDIPPVGGGGVESGTGSSQADELLVQLARLSEPLAVPNSLNTIGTPSAYGTIENSVSNSDAALLNHKVIDRPSADEGSEATGVAVPTESGWKFFGVLWYWWVIPVAIFVAVIARTIRLVRSSQAFLYSGDQI